MKFVIKYKSKRTSNCKWHCHTMFGKIEYFADYQSAADEATLMAGINKKYYYAVFKANGDLEKEV